MARFISIIQIADLITILIKWFFIILSFTSNYEQKEKKNETSLQCKWELRPADNMKN